MPAGKRQRGRPKRRREVCYKADIKGLSLDGGRYCIEPSLSLYYITKVNSKEYKINNNINYKQKDKMK